VPTDVVEVNRIRNLGQVVDITGKAPEGWIIGDAPQVALKMPVVHGIEPH
jgi:hypothetical protein